MYTFVIECYNKANKIAQQKNSWYCTSVKLINKHNQTFEVVLMIFQLENSYLCNQLRKVRFCVTNECL